MEQEITIIPEVEELNVEVQTEQGVFPQGEININSNGIVNVSEYATANVEVSFNLQDKDVSITQNGTDIITADEGYMGMSSVNISTNVPAPKYAPKYIRFQNYNGDNLLEETKQLDVSNMTSLADMFNSCQALKYFDFSEWDTSKITNMSNMFYYCFRTAYNVELDLSSFTNNNPLNMSQMFYSCSQLKSINLSNITKVSQLDYAFRSCNKLETLDISNMDFSGINSSETYKYNQLFIGCGTSTASGLTTVYVKDQTAQDWILNLSTGHRPASWTTDNVIIKS